MSDSQLAKLMMGREVTQLRAKTAPPRTETILTLKDIWAKGNRGVNALKGVSFSIQRGEVLGVVGVAGNGQAELAEVLTGLRRPSQGQMILDNQDVTALGVKGLFEAGVAHIPEDRNHMGIVPSFSVAENIILRQFRYKPFAKGALLDRDAANTFADRSIQDFEIATPSKTTPTRLLSGGNVQKLILARELSLEPKLVVAVHPTYGLDVAATALTHNLLLKQRERGAGVLLISEDLDEILKLADRIIVLFRGEITGDVGVGETDRELLGLLMAGVKEREVGAA